MEFSFQKAELEEFAILSDTPPSEIKDFYIDAGISIKIDIENRMLIFDLTVQYLDGDVSLMKVKSVFDMLIEEGSWNEMIEGSLINFKKGFIQFLGKLCLDTLRGMLIIKLRNTSLKNIILPPLSVEKLLSEDIEFNLDI